MTRRLQKCKSLKKLIGNNRVCEGHRRGGGWNIFAASTQIHKCRCTQVQNALKYTSTLRLANKVKTNIVLYQDTQFVMNDQIKLGIDYLKECL